MSSLLAILLTMIVATSALSYPRPLHPGGFSLPPMVEDLIPIATSKIITTTTTDSDSQPEDVILQKDLLLVRPPDMESLWEWYAYTKRQTDSDPSWGRIWPTALSLARFTLQSLHLSGKEESSIDFDFTSNLNEQERALVKQAIKALQTTSHIIELGCGLGLAGLSFAVSAATESPNVKRTVTFLDREPYALHCVMASAAINNLATASISSEKGEVVVGSTAPLITARSSIDDWTNEDHNISYKDLQLNALDYDNEQTIILASDILYEPSSMDSLASKLRNLLLPNEGGYVLITDPQKERTSGCRSALVKSVKEMGGEVVILPIPQPTNDGITMTNKAMMVESDVDIDGNLAKTVLIVVHFNGA